MNVSKRRIIMNTFFKSQFSYCPLAWMCHSHANHSKINRLHEQCLHIIYSDKTSSIESLLEKASSVSIQNRKLHLLATEMYKACKGLSPSITTELFKKKNEHLYNLRHNSQFTIPVNSVYHETESVSFLGPKIW